MKEKNQYARLASNQDALDAKRAQAPMSARTGVYGKKRADVGDRDPSLNSRCAGRLLVGWAIVLVLALMPATSQSQIFTTIKSFGILTNVTGLNPLTTLVQGVDGTLYGTTRNGEGSVAGTVFKVQPDCSGFTVLKLFMADSMDGANPFGLVLAGNLLYGTALYGGISNNGTIYKLNTDGTGYTVLKRFAGSDGANPAFATLILSGSVLYGATLYGGSSTAGYGTVFKMNTDGTGYTVLKNFTGAGAGDGAYPNTRMTLASGVLYGTTENGGSSDAGTIYKLNTNGTGYKVIKSFTNVLDGAYPDGALIFAGGVLYGTTYRGGSWGDGTVFQMNTNGTGYSVLKSFTGGDGANPHGLLMSGSALYGTTVSGGSSSTGTVFTLNTNGTGFTVLQNFAGSPDGASPYADVTLSGNVLYGTTFAGGNSDSGTLFRVNTNGTGYSVLKHFACSDGNYPHPLVLSNGVLYGTTFRGGSLGVGTLFQVNTDGSGYSILKNFGGSDGEYPSGNLLLSDGALYGTTRFGGISSTGTVFKLNTDGTGFTVLQNFAGSPDGAIPDTGLTLSGGVLYGITAFGGAGGNYGTVFAINTNGTGYSVLQNFANSPDGETPLGALTLLGSVLYGTTQVGGNSGGGTVFQVNTDGTGYAVLHNFSDSDGTNPYTRLVVSGNVLYGTTANGGAFNDGTIFKINADGTGFGVLKHFAGSDGAHPYYADLTLSGGVLYGATFYGGSSNLGTLFRLNTDGTGYTVLKHFTGGEDGAGPNAALIISGSVLYGTAELGGSLGDGTVFSLLFPPQLSITPSGSNVILSWPTNVAGLDYTGYTLQSTTNLNAPVVWVTNSPLPVVVNGLNTVTNLITGAQRFYRLIQ